MLMLNKIYIYIYIYESYLYKTFQHSFHSTDRLYVQVFTLTIKLGCKQVNVEEFLFA